MIRILSIDTHLSLNFDFAETIKVQNAAEQTQIRLLVCTVIRRRSPKRPDRRPGLSYRLMGIPGLVDPEQIASARTLRDTEKS